MGGVDYETNIIVMHVLSQYWKKDYFRELVILDLYGMLYDGSDILLDL